jgi:hypothetical protein
MLPTTMLDLQRRSSTGVPVSWKGMEAGKEGHRSGHALGPEDLDIIPEEAAEKVETFFFFFSFGLIVWFVRYAFSDGNHGL